MTARLSQSQLRRVFAAFPTGVAAVAAVIDGEPAGLAASSFVSVSLDPPLVSVCVARTSTTWPALRTAGRLGISVLGDHQEQASRQLSSRAAGRFAGLDWRATAADSSYRQLTSRCRPGASPLKHFGPAGLAKV